MKIYDNECLPCFEGYATFEYHGHIITFEDSRSAFPTCTYADKKLKGAVVMICATVEQAIEAINKLELKLAEV